VSRHAGPIHYVIDVLADVNYGDHGDRTRKSLVPLEGETVEELIRRAFRDLDGSRWKHHCSTDTIEIRVAEEPDGEPSGQQPMPTGAPF
jgi:hypothetical protein